MAGTQGRQETAEGHGGRKSQGGETLGPSATWASTPRSFTLAAGPRRVAQPPPPRPLLEATPAGVQGKESGMDGLRTSLLWKLVGRATSTPSCLSGAEGASTCRAGVGAAGPGCAAPAALIPLSTADASRLTQACNRGRRQMEAVNPSGAHHWDTTHAPVRLPSNGGHPAGFPRPGAACPQGTRPLSSAGHARPPGQGWGCIKPLCSCTPHSRRPRQGEGSPRGAMWQCDPQASRKPAHGEASGYPGGGGPGRGQLVVPWPSQVTRPAHGPAAPISRGS